MTFQSEFNELKCSLEPTVAKNPILNKEQEFLIFSQINATKNFIVAQCLVNDQVYARFLELLNSHVCNETEHELFMFESFSSESEFDSRAKEIVDFVRNASRIGKQGVLAKIPSMNASFDVYKVVYDAYVGVADGGVVLDTLTSDMQYYIDKVYLSNMKLLLRVISAYRNTNDLTVKDLFSEGAIGLRRAIERFNCTLGVKFSTYATQWMKATINRAIADKDSLIRIPVNVREQIKDVEKIKKTLRKSLGREPEEAEILERMKKKSNSLASLDVSFSYYNIDSNSFDREDSTQSNSSFEENLIDKNLLDECDTATIREMKGVIAEYIESISNYSDRYYIQYYFGFNDKHEVKGKEEIIRDLNIQPNEYDRIRKRVMSNMKRMLGRNKTLVDAYSIESGWESNSNMEY